VDLTTFFQQLVNGLQLGSIYALIALGYTMVYGIIKLINFAHGDFLMVGAYAVYFFATFLLALTNAIPPIILFILCLIVSLAAGALIAELSNRLAYKPLRYRPRLSALITAVGVSMFLEYFFASLPFIGPSFRAFPDIIKQVSFVVGGVYLNNIQLLDIGLAIVLMILLSFIVNRTMTGKAMRAVSQDKDAARLMGINIERTITFTFLIGGALAGAAGILMAMTYPRIFPYMGILPGLKAFVAAVLGGIGNIPGAMLGGFLLGIAEIYATSYNSLLGEGIAFAILILVLLFRPQGLLGEKQSEKV
jgi:branched-chain amino acid transport system permease protein